MRHTGAKNKVARREGIDLGMKTLGTHAHATLLKRLNVRPGQHGTKNRRKISDHAKQLREKQKLRSLFGLTERQLKNYYDRAVQVKGNTAVILASQLERRLDNIVFRLGFAPTRASARQLVGHGHIAVDGKKVDVPSYRLSPKEKISFKSNKSSKIPYIEMQLDNKSTIIPPWLQREDLQGHLVSEPDSTEVEKQVNLRSVIEYYSR